MFYVNNVDGLQFSGPMELLEQSRRVNASHAAKKIEFEDQLQGSLSEQKQDKRLAAYQKMIQRDNMVEPLVHIFQIMSSSPVTITPEISIIDAWNILRKKDIRQVIVTDEKMQVVGMLSDRDVLRHLNVDGDDIKVEINPPVAKILESEIVSTATVSDIRRVARVMAYYHLDAMPVLKDTSLVGIVTRGDILRGFAENPRLNLWG